MSDPAALQRELLAAMASTEGVMGRAEAIMETLKSVANRPAPRLEEIVINSDDAPGFDSLALGLKLRNLEAVERYAGRTEVTQWDLIERVVAATSGAGGPLRR